MASRKKRPRGDREAEAIRMDEQAAASLRARLLHRIDGTPSYWTEIEARLGTIGADAGLCALGREVAGVIRGVGESAEAERQRFEALRATFHIAVDARINELLSKVTTAESAKIAALERELERLDATLERTRREHAAAREALTSKSDDEITALSAALTVSLDDIDALLATLPHGPVEPSMLRLELDEGALLSSIRTAGTVLAPRGVHAADVVVRGLPTTVRPGRPLQFELVLCDDYPCRAPAELEASAASLAFHARVDMSLETRASSPLLWTRQTLRRLFWQWQACPPLLPPQQQQRQRPAPPATATGRARSAWGARRCEEVCLQKAPLNHALQRSDALRNGITKVAPAWG
jgi:hypothetical protein